MISIEQATQEISTAITSIFAADAEIEWHKGIAVAIGTPVLDEPKRPSKYARVIQLRFGSVAMNQYRAPDAATRKTRCTWVARVRKNAHVRLRSGRRRAEGEIRQAVRHRMCTGHA